MSDIILKNINKCFGDKQIFDNLSLNIEQGEFVSIMGRSGAGKTTLLNIMGMIEKADSGEVLLFHKSCLGFFSRSATKLRRTKISYLFQNYGLIENQTVAENMKLATKFKKISRSAKKELIQAALNQVGLSNYAQNKVYTLSGGEQQRVALAKIIAKSPQIILADEPTGSLDQENRDYVLSILKHLNSQGKTVVVVTHDSCVNEAASRHIVLK